MELGRGRHAPLLGTYGLAQGLSSLAALWNYLGFFFFSKSYCPYPIPTHEIRISRAWGPGMGIFLKALWVILMSQTVEMDAGAAKVGVRRCARPLPTIDLMGPKG